MEEKKKVSRNQISKRKRPGQDSLAERNYDMLVFSHLRWGFVYQRPQHIISRLSRNLKILFIEEPIAFEEGEENTYDIELINQNLHILKPKTESIQAISHVLQKYLKTKKVFAGWFYSPAFSPLIGDFNFDILIYDCMDELSLFKGAPSHLIEQEKFLLSEADIVFTGGKSLFESKNRIHNNVHCFPSSVERKHFSRALKDEPLPQDIRKIKKPIVGYFGVIDERVNLELLRETALMRPEVNFVMIGPLAKIGENDLPRERNIHYLGMKSYESLPGYLRAFDIAMMPFALNDATRFISPTKTLEYMAAGKPIISTSIKDVIRDYNHCISIVATEKDFSRSIDILLETEDRNLIAIYDTILNKTSWDSTARAMTQLIKTTVG